ncbi:cytochrome ubiquinol oxidase subunit I [Nonomuraea sp. NPDC048916]|uniref:cytochrome ubiquinol oxidase subunit I n=1 Tax=Nonomuraea sp. NPDC048916 TaxID=3154232 RepID=UPI00340A0D52
MARRGRRRGLARGQEGLEPPGRGRRGRRPRLTALGWRRSAGGPFLRRGRIFLYAIPLPFIAVTRGWIFREAGRRPWAIYEQLKTADAITPGAGASGSRLSGRSS